MLAVGDVYEYTKGYRTRIVVVKDRGDSWECQVYFCYQSKSNSHVFLENKKNLAEEFDKGNYKIVPPSKLQ